MANVRVKFKKRSRLPPPPEKSLSVSPARELERRWVNDELVEKLDTLLDAASKVDCTKHIQEISYLHKTRDIRYLKGDYSIEIVSDMALQETSTRSSIVGIAAKVQWYITKLEALRKAIRVKTTATDYAWLADNVKTQNDRTLVVESLLIDADIVIADLHALYGFAEAIIADIDKSSYTISNLMKGFELEYKVERTYHGK